MYQKAIIATALSSILSHFCPIDDWTHFGAAFTGIAYGYFTCPTLQLNHTSSKTGQKEGITLVRRYADPCKSLIIFTLFVLVLICVLFFIEPPLNTLVFSSFEQRRQDYRKKEVGVFELLQLAFRQETVSWKQIRCLFIE